MKRRITAVLAAAVLSSTCLIPGIAHAADTNLIPDAALNKCFAYYMGTVGVAPSEAGVISQADLDALAAATTEPYSFWCGGVGSLEGFQYLKDPELTNLVFGYGSLTDLTPLSGMTQLGEINVSYSHVSDLSPLTGLTNLYALNVGYNDVSDLSPLTGLISLTYLDVTSNMVSDLSPLAGLTALEELHAGHNQITDLSPLAKLTALNDLEISNNQVSDLPPLAGLTALTYLLADHNQIVDVSPLAGLDLNWLYLHNNKIKDIAPVADLLNSKTTLRWTLANNQITDASSLDWSKVGSHWSGSLMSADLDIVMWSVAMQTSTGTATQWTTVPLPAVTATGGPALTWTVLSGQAKINAAKGTVTYDAAGPVVLQWTDDFPVECGVLGALSLCDAGAEVVQASFFSGMITINVAPAVKNVQAGGSVQGAHNGSMALAFALALCVASVFAVAASGKRAHI